MHDVAYDHVTDTLVGSNQDNCVVYQSAPGSLIWPVGPGYSGDGGDVAVADLGGGQSVRYASNQNLGSFQRQVYNASNNLVSKTDLSTSVITDKQFTTPVVVNTVDPNRLLIGGSANLYESLDQGTTINKIATVGVNYRAIAYGGRKNGVANPDVFYVANGTNTFYARTTAGGAVAATGALPSGAWYIRDIVMNPADWMNVFAVDDNQVFASNDAGATWSDITGNLLSVSSAEISTIEFVAGSVALHCGRHALRRVRQQPGGPGELARAGRGAAGRAGLRAGLRRHGRRPGGRHLGTWRLAAGWGLHVFRAAPRGPDPDPQWSGRGQ